MATGTVKWFNSQKGYGFIAPSTGGPDVFVHISAVERAGLSGLNEGQTVEFETEVGRNGKSSAINLLAWTGEKSSELTEQISALCRAFRDAATARAGAPHGEYAPAPPWHARAGSPPGRYPSSA